LRSQIAGSKDDAKEESSEDTQFGSERHTQDSGSLPRKKNQGKEVRSSGSVDAINTMGRDALMNVNGIGPILADKIIPGRPYSSQRDMVERGIISQR